jgi:hypothetical protein
MAGKKLFDRKFVIAAVLVGVVYTLVVIVVEKIVGKEAAGVAGVALTAIAVAIFQKFETLRFRPISDDKSTWVDVPAINVSRVIVLTFAFLGAQYVFGFASGLLPEKWLDQDETMLMLAVLNIFVYFFASFLMAKAFIQLRYTTVAVAILLTLTISILMSAVQFRLEVGKVIQLIGLGAMVGAQGVFWLVFEVVALLGVRLGLPSDKKQ